MPYGAVWDYHCLQMDTPPGGEWIGDIRKYEKDVLSKR
jgi:L-rhamnose isomerase